MTLVRALDVRWAVGGTLGVVPLLVLGPCGTWRTFLRVVRLSPWVPPCVDFRRCIFAYAGLVRGGGGIASAWPRPYHAAIGGICSPTAVRVSPLAFHHDPLLSVGCFRSGTFWIISYLVMLEMLQAHSAHGGDIYIYIYIPILYPISSSRVCLLFRRFQPPRRLGGGTCRQRLLLPPGDHARHPGWLGRIVPHWHRFARMPQADAPVHGVPLRTSPQRSHGPPPCLHFSRTYTPLLH